jgi:hypothetical protein
VHRRVGLADRAPPPAPHRAEAWIYALAGPVLFMRPAFKTVDIGQINLVLWTVVLVDVFAVGRGRRWGGVGVGLAAAVKLVPALFVLLYVVAGRWAAAVRAAATFVALGVLAWILDPADSREYWTKLVWDASRIGPVADAQNNSLRFVLAQTSLPERAQLAVWAVAVLALGVVGLWRAGQAWRRGSVLYAVVITGCVAALASPISWTHHLVFLPLIILFLPRTRWPVLVGRSSSSPSCSSGIPGQGYDVVTASLRAVHGGGGRRPARHRRSRRHAVPAAWPRGPATRPGGRRSTVAGPARPGTRRGAHDLGRGDPAGRRRGPPHDADPTGDGLMGDGPTGDGLMGDGPTGDGVMGDAGPAGGLPGDGGSPPAPPAPPDGVPWFAVARFGLFVHWGLFAPGLEPSCRWSGAAPPSRTAGRPGGRVLRRCRRGCRRKAPPTGSATPRPRA